MENAPHFFKIILDSTIRQGKLAIPRKFVKKYGNCLSSPVILSVPSGTIWRVELLKCNDDVWLGQGWQDFSNYYSLERGSFLVFKYEGECRFHVVIFDKSASEIEYPYNNSHNANPNHDELQDIKIEENEDGISVKALDVLSRCKKVEEKSTFLHPQSRKVKQSRCKKNDRRKVGRPPSFPITSQALEAANNYVAKYPSFTVLMKRYHWENGLVVLPSGFFESHFECKTQSIMLQNADRFWPVKLICSSDSTRASFSAGWRVFSRENAIEVGDACVFELIKRNVLNVTIFRCVD